uniref:Glycosyltransferase family 92 protein n=1 Tax=Stomoxys calcitrans TaxID=35570 RepID=A0A1I8PEY1_STOCA
MAPKSKMLKLLILVIFVWLFVILLMNVFSSGESYYYSKLLGSLDDHQSLLNLEQQQRAHGDGGISLDKDPYGDYSYKEPKEEEIAAQLELDLPNVPFVYADRHKNRTMRKSRNCAIFPYLQTLKYYNNFWQTYTNMNVTFHLYAAYYDDRPGVEETPAIRILAMINQLHAPFPTSYCHIWYENQEIPHIVPISEYSPIWYWGGEYMFFTHLLTCFPPKVTVPGRKVPVPRAVGIVNHQCDTPTNMLKVIYRKPASNSTEKIPFAVCVKGLDFPYADISNRLAEWLEMQRLLGAHKVYMYNIAIHPNVKKLLDYYEAEGFVEVRPITLVEGVVGLPHMQHWILGLTLFNKRLNELIPYNDCFYRHMYEYEYIAIIDVDEIIMPLGELQTWQDIVNVSVAAEEERNCVQGFAALCFRNTYFPYRTDNFTLSPETGDNHDHHEVSPIPAHMFFLGHKYRTSNYSRVGFATKCLHRTSKVKSLHNHYPVHWSNSCGPTNIPQTLAHLQHYQDFQPTNEFQILQTDYSLERYRASLVDRTTEVLRQLGILK